MSRLTLNGPVVIRADRTRDGRWYDFAAINIAGMTFHADVNSADDERSLYRVAKEAEVEVIDWRKPCTT